MATIPESLLRKMIFFGGRTIKFQSVIICHFYNDASILPFWLSHYVPQFSHGVMIDYGATDGSQELIKKYVPHWEIRPTKNKYFEEPGITKEVIEIEINLQSHHLLQIYHFLDYPDIA